MICWSCERGADAGPLCGSCGAILPPDIGVDHFTVLGLERRYQVDLADAETRFRALSRQLHPDRYAKADPRARRASLQRSVQLNDAWRTIKDSVRRAEYLLHLAGYEVDGEKQGPAQTADGTARARIPTPPQLLAEILGWREDLDDARAAGDDARIQAMAARMRERLAASLLRVDRSLDNGDGAPAGPGQPQWEQAAGELIAIRYFRRFLDEVAAHDESVAAGAEGASHA